MIYVSTVLQLLTATDFRPFCRTNRTLYGPVSLKPLPHNYKPRPLPLPRTGALEDDKDVLATETDEEEEEDKEEGDRGEDEQCSESSSEPLKEGLVTFSTLPKSHWASLPNLELIKVGTG